MGNGRWSFRLLATHLLLCGPVPNRPRTGTGLRPGGWGPLAYMTLLHEPFWPIIVPLALSIPEHCPPLCWLNNLGTLLPQGFCTCCSNWDAVPSYTYGLLLYSLQVFIQKLFCQWVLPWLPYLKFQHHCHSPHPPLCVCILTYTCIHIPLPALFFYLTPLSNVQYISLITLIYLASCLLHPLDCQLHEGRDFCMLCSVSLSLQHLDQGLADAH